MSSPGSCRLPCPRVLTTCIALAGSVAFPAATIAQTPRISGQVERTYVPQEFARFAPRTALDLLQLVPGFVVADSEERRGLGGLSENILINGQAVRGKSNDAIDALARITAADVVRIDIVSSASGEGAGVGRQVANVIVQTANRPKGQFSWRPSTRLRNLDAAYFNGDASVSGRTGILEYTAGVRNDGLRTGAGGPSRILNAAGGLIESRDDRFIENSDRTRLSADLRLNLPSSALIGLRGSVQRYAYRFRERSDRSAIDLGDRTRSLTQRQNDKRYEVAADADFGLGAGRLKLIALHAVEQSPVDTRVSTLFIDDGGDEVGNRFLRDGEQRETVFRSEYGWSAGKNEWRVSAERARNQLDNESTFFELMPDGSFEEVIFPNASGEVRELRHEAALALTRNISSRLSLRGSIGGEISRLDAPGPGDERVFRRPKGYVSIAWQAAPRLRVTAKVERRVGQISFFDFLASRNLSEDRQNASNPDLVPPQSWDLEAEVRRDLATLGSTTVRVYGQRITDLIDQVPIGEDQEAPGNLDTARIFGIDWKTTLYLDRMGWRGARMDLRAQVQKSAVDDPVTGRSRRISNNLVRLIDASVRHDVPGTSWAWGAGLSHILRAADFRIGETARYRQGPLSGNLYVENKDVAGLTVRAGLSNLISSGQDLDRTIFVNRRDGPVQSFERRRRSVGPVFSLSVSGNF